MNLKNPSMAALSLLLVSGATAQNLITNGDFSSGDLTGWTQTANAPTTITYDGESGNPAGSAKMARNDSTDASNANYLYQIVPVVIGQQYQISADWQGDLYNGGSGRNWAELYLNFGPTAESVDPLVAPGAIYYKRATDGNNSTNPNTTVSYENPWEWQSVIDSPIDTATPTDGIFTATDNFMLIAFNVGGRAAVGPGYFSVDNVSLVAVAAASEPVVSKVSLAGPNIVLEGSDGPPDGGFEMLRSSDLSLPIDSWTNVGVGTFDSSGDFLFESERPADPASFYRLRTTAEVSPP